MMRFYFPDSQDQVDPTFDFEREEHLPHHVRQRDDRYAHEVLTERAYDGMLVSKAIVDGLTGSATRYTSAQRRRLYDSGARGFFRLDAHGRTLESMGDCGAFSYIEDEVPPITVDDAIDFYDGCGFDAGVSVDHLVPAFHSDRIQHLALGDELAEEIARWERRIDITLENAAAFLRRHHERGCTFEPIGAAQGYSPSSYARSVEALQRMGYRRIALGGMVPMKTDQIVESLQAIDGVRLPETQMHLLGVTRTHMLETFSRLGVTSFDSTSPFRQSFMDDTDNYYWPGGKRYVAVRVPPIDGNARLKARIRAGQVDQDAARIGERECLRLLRAYAAREVPLREVVAALRSFVLLTSEPDKKSGGVRDRTVDYAEVLEDRPWERCSCGVCERVGIEVILFRGTERNKRRGFHNLAVFNADLQQRIAASGATSARSDA